MQTIHHPVSNEFDELEWIWGAAGICPLHVCHPRVLISQESLPSTILIGGLGPG